jgi:quinol monooxygenase YgiN
MIIVTGSVRVRPDSIERALELSLEHVARSRQEAGCLFHSVLRDVEDPQRLVFVERWADDEALRTHFAVPASIAFVRELASVADDAPAMSLFEAQQIEI